MRQLNRGITLIELMVTLVLLAVLLSLGAPAMAEYVRNAKLREASNSVVAVLLFARSEAIKRNEPLSVSIAGADLVVRDTASKTLRRDALPAAVAASAARTSDGSDAPEIRFDGAGRTLPFGAAFRIDTTMAGMACDDTTRCPRVMVRSGGAVRQCSQREDC